MAFLCLFALLPSVSAVEITSNATATAYAGEAFSYQIEPAGAQSYAAAGLPAGFSCNATTGLISGNSTSNGNFPVTLSATDGTGTGTKLLALKIYNTSALANWRADYPLPLNASFAARIALSGTTANAIGSNYVSNPDASGAPVWWSWTPAVTGNVTIDTFVNGETFGKPLDQVPTFDTVLEVSTGNSPDALVQLAANDDYYIGNTSQSLVTFHAVAGTEYQIKVDDSPNYQGQGMIALQIAQDVRQLTVSSSGNGTASGSGTFGAGEFVTATATANAGYKFSSWTDNGTPVSTAAAYSFTLTSNRTLVANFAPLPPVESWRQTNFGPAATNSGNAADTADPDHDGLPNLLEYALGGNPNSSDSASIAPIIDAADGTLKISFGCNSAHTDITYIVQSTNDLTNWTDIAQSTGGGAFTALVAGITVSDPDLSKGAGQRLVTVAAPLATKLFLRVKTTN